MREEKALSSSSADWLGFSPVGLIQALDAFRAQALQIGGLHGTRAEQSLYGPFGTLLQQAAVGLGYPVTIVQQVGRLDLVPDYGVFRGGHVVGWVELKAPDKDLDNLRGHDLRQFRRALNSLEAFALTNGWDWRYFEQGTLVDSARLPADLLTNATSQPSAPAVSDLGGLLDRVLGRTPLQVATLEEAIQLMARRASRPRSSRS